MSSDTSDGTTIDGSSMAEYQRISADMEKLSKRQIWEGVEKQFVKLEALAVSIEYKHYLLGAQSSQEIGNIYVALQRLKRAKGIKKRQKEKHRKINMYINTRPSSLYKWSMKLGL